MFLYKGEYGDVFRLQKLNEIRQNTRTSSSLNTSAWSRYALHCIFSCMTTKKNLKEECLVRSLKFRKIPSDCNVLYSATQKAKGPRALWLTQAYNTSTCNAEVWPNCGSWQLLRRSCR